MMYFGPSQMMSGGWPPFNGGFSNFGWGGFQSPMMGLARSMYQPGQEQGLAAQISEPDTPNYKPKIDRLKNRIGALQGQVASADPARATQIQSRIGDLRGRVKDVRQQRRQDSMGGAPQVGMTDWMRPQQVAYRPQQGMAPRMQQPSMPPQQGGGWNPLTTPTGMGNMFDTQWGRLVPSSGGNQNVFQLENDPSRMFHFDPRAMGNDGAGARGGWKSMTPESYASYGDYDYADPRQFGAAANPMMQEWVRGPSGLIQGKVGTGSYA